MHIFLENYEIKITRTTDKTSPVDHLEELAEIECGCPHWHGGECQDHAEIILTEEDVAEMQAQVEADKALLAKAEAERDAYRCACTTLDKLRRAYGIRPDADPVAELDSRFECMERELVLALAKLRDARQDGIAQGVKWASAHPRIRRFDYAEPLHDYVARGIQEVGG